MSTITLEVPENPLAVNFSNYNVVSIKPGQSIAVTFIYVGGNPNGSMEYAFFYGPYHPHSGDSASGPHGILGPNKNTGAIVSGTPLYATFSSDDVPVGYLLGIGFKADGTAGSNFQVKVSITGDTLYRPYSPVL